MSFPVDLSPQERLAISRKAIVRHMNRHYPDVHDENSVALESNIGTEQQVTPSRFSQVKYAARMWWQRHPASTAVDLASPLLHSYAKAYPFKFLGISFATGAILMFVRPWKMISGSALIIAAVKSSGLSNTLLSMLSSLAIPPNDSNTG